MQIQLYFYSAVNLQCQVLFADVSLYDVIFKVGSKSEKYKLTVGGFKGSLGMSMLSSNSLRWYVTPKSYLMDR